MIRVDYSGLDWSKVGTRTNLKCRCCGGTIYHSEKHDARFCSSCGRWIDKRCKPPYCPYCKDRPANAVTLLYRYYYEHLNKE